MIELNAVHFAARSPSHITVANRTLERAQVLARRFNGTAITLSDLPEQLAQHDIIVTCTASQLPILGRYGGTLAQGAQTSSAVYC